MLQREGEYIFLLFSILVLKIDDLFTELFYKIDKSNDRLEITAWTLSQLCWLSAKTFDQGLQRDPKKFESQDTIHTGW